ncbi:tripartite tricarboxylate transporter substrate binding protein [soil metagenome]
MRNACLNRRTFTLGVAALALTDGPTAFAQAYPDRPVRFVVPMAPGGSVDVVSRAVAQVLAQRLGQSVVVDNKPGAGGALAASFVSGAAPDGYTVFVADTGQLAINPSLYKKLPYDARMPFVPVTEAVAAPLYLVVNSSLPVNTVQEFIAYAKAQNAPLAYGSTGVGSVHHLGMEHLASATGIKVNHIPYKGAAQSSAAVAAGEVQAAFSALPSLRPLIAAGKVKVLAVALPARTALTPEVPTIAESGVKGFDASVTIGFVLPPRTSDAIAQRLQREIIQALATVEVQKQLAALGLVPMGNTSAQYGQNIESDTVKYRDLIKLTGATAE